MDAIYLILSVLLPCGFVAGFLAGLFGIGGGVIMVPVMFILLSNLGYGDYAMTMAVATSAAVILPTALSGTIRNRAQLQTIAIPAVILGLGGIGGSGIGSTLSVIIDKNLHIISFSCFLLCLAVWMWTRKYQSHHHIQTQESIGIFLLIGVTIGLCAGLFGIGGGVILTPILTSLLGINIHRSIGISLGSMVLISSGTILSYIILGLGMTNPAPFSVGYVNLLYAAILICTSVPAVHFGIKTGEKIPEMTLRIMFIGLLLVLAFRMMLSIWI